MEPEHDPLKKWNKYLENQQFLGGSMLVFVEELRGVI